MAIEPTHRRQLQERVLSDAYLTLDRNWRFTHLNPEAERILERREDELLGKVIWEAFPALAELAFYRELRRSLRESRTVHFQEYYPPLARWFHVHAYPSEHGLAIYFQDITGEHRSRTRQEFRAQLLDRVTHPIVAFDDQDRVTYWNEAAEAILGWSADEVLGWPLPDIFVDDEERARVAEVRRGLREGREWSGEVKAVRRDGRDVVMRVATAPAPTPEGTPGGRVVSAVDVTELRVNQERLSLAAEAGHIGVFEWNVAEARLWVSESLYEIYGLEPGRDTLDRETWLDRVYPKDRDRAVAELDHAIQVGRTYESEFRILHPEGVLRWLSSRARITRHPDGSPERMVGVVYDVTQRKRAEEAVRENEQLFRQIAETVEGVFWITDPHTGRIEYVSPGYATIWGRLPEEVYADPGLWMEAVHPDDRSRLREARGRQLQGTYDLEYRIVRPDGTIRWIWDRAFLTESTTGEVSRIVGVAEDVTERKRLDERLRQAQKMEAVGRLSGGVAHDFNNRLTVIQNSSQLLLDELPEDSPLRETVQDILRESARAATSTRQLLAFSRRQVLDERVLSPGKLVGRLRAMLQSLVPESIELGVEVEDEDALVRAGRNELEQVLLNLVINAADAIATHPDPARPDEAPDAGQRGRIAVRVRRVTLSEEEAAEASMGPGSDPLPPGPYVELQVADTGSGMPPEVRERIFEPFYTTKPSHKGTGLGLSTVYGIAQQSGGDVWVDTEPGEGTAFRVFFPEAEGPEDEDAAHEALQETLDRAPQEELTPLEADASHAPGTAPPPADTPAEPAGPTVLLVEDEVPVRKVASRVLSRSGYRVLEAETGGKALELAEHHGDTIDVVVSDVVMPEMDGATLVDRLRERRPGLAVVLMSGYSEKELGAEARRKATVFLEKPFAPEELIQAIRAAIPSPGDSPTPA